MQRTPVTLFNLNLRGKRQSLSAFLENESIDIDFDLMKQEVFGHNRLYYHSGTCQPIKPHELDEDSEDERDPEWMRIKTQIVSGALHSPQLNSFGTHSELISNGPERPN